MFFFSVDESTMHYSPERCNVYTLPDMYIALHRLRLNRKTHTVGLVHVVLYVWYVIRQCYFI